MVDFPHVGIFFSQIHILVMSETQVVEPVSLAASIKKTNDPKKNKIRKSLKAVLDAVDLASGGSKADPEAVLRKFKHMIPSGSRDNRPNPRGVEGVPSYDDALQSHDIASLLLILRRLYNLSPNTVIEGYCKRNKISAETDDDDEEDDEEDEDDDEEDDEEEDTSESDDGDSDEADDEEEDSDSPAPKKKRVTYSLTQPSE